MTGVIQTLNLLFTNSLAGYGARPVEDKCAKSGESFLIRGSGLKRLGHGPSEG